MSTLGLHTGYYADIRDFAELLDEALVEMKSCDGSDLHARELGELLLQSTTPNVSGHLPQFVSMLLNSFPKLRGRGAEIGQRLLEGASRPGDIGCLEELAQTVERDRAETFSKMRGK